jgi:hypothetical protein
MNGETFGSLMELHRYAEWPNISRSDSMSHDLQIFPSLQTSGRLTSTSIPVGEAPDVIHHYRKIHCSYDPAKPIL